MTDEKQSAPASVKTSVDKEAKVDEVKKNKEEVKTIIRKKFTGVVLADKMDKTIVVRVDRVKKDAKYGKRYTASRKYKVHDSENKFKVDDKVNFVECRPLSKDKRWRVIYS